jgi:hypothetical protein
VPLPLGTPFSQTAFLRELWAADGATSVVILMSAAKDLYLFSLGTLRSLRRFFLAAPYSPSAAENGKIGSCSAAAIHSYQQRLPAPSGSAQTKTKTAQRAEAV